jgi:adenosine deaminase
MVRRSFFVFLALCTFAAPAFADERGAAAELERIRNSPLELRRFVEALPKGGDLHNHLSGAVYAESYVAWAAADGLCVNKITFYIAPPPCTAANLVSAAAAQSDSTLYQHVLDTMSMRQFRPIAESGHDHFFRTFPAFSAVSGTHTGDMLKEVVGRLAAENVDYLETMVSLDHGAAWQAGDGLAPGQTFAQMRDALLRDGAMANIVTAARKALDDAESKLGSLKCSAPDQRNCSVVRYVSQVSRNDTREEVFAEILFGFELATADARVVAVDPVAPEDGYVSMRDFDQQMQMFGYLHGLYPRVGLTMHAGELANGLVPPEGMRTHIRGSVDAGAQRIGHGVDIMRETSAEGTLRTMAAKPVAVEICLTSNDVILGVRGKDHPLRTYLQHGVPAVLATDDPGVSRGDLSTEYQRAVEDQGMTYKELKQFARNALQWSFLQGASLWSDRAYTSFVADCAHDVPGRQLSPACHTYLAGNPKAMQQWRLEERLHDFEQRYP